MVLLPHVGCVGSGGQDPASALAVGQKETFVLWLVQEMEGSGGMPGFGVPRGAGQQVHLCPMATKLSREKQNGGAGALLAGALKIMPPKIVSRHNGQLF